MPRANRHFLPNHIWHITHRCHKKEFLLKFAKDRKNWLRWLFEARKRHRLCVLNYVVTSNHIHLLVKDGKESAIAKSMQLIAGRTAQAYNSRKNRKGAFWEDRYHATAIESDNHLVQCLVYMDLNMVRAGVVQHPHEWAHGGYREIQSPPVRYAIIDQDELVKLTGTGSIEGLQLAHRGWINSALEGETGSREALWSESVAVGRKAYVESVQSELGLSVKGRHCLEDGEVFFLKEPSVAYSTNFGAKKVGLSH